MSRSASTSDEERLAALAAYLSSSHGGRKALTQAEIADWQIQGLASQSAVSRAVLLARKRGYLVEAAPTLDQESLMKGGLWVEVEHLIAMSELRAKLTVLAQLQGWPRVPVLHCIPVRVNIEGPKEERRRDSQAFFEQAGRVGYSLMEHSSAIGLSWGETLGNLVAAVEAHAPVRPTTPRQIQMTVPLVGEPPRGETSEFSSTLLAERLYRALRGDEETRERYSLRYVHSFISDALAEWHADQANLVAGDRRVVGRDLAFRYYEQVSSHGDIFGGSTPIVETLDAVLTSLSIDGVPWGSVTQLGVSSGTRVRHQTLPHMLGADRQVMEDVRRVAIGDICGVLLPHDPEKPDQELAELQARWTGITPDQLKRLADRGSGPGRPGVVVVALGPKKVRTTLAAMRLGYVNHLVIGEALAQALNTRITRTLASRRRRG